VKALNPIAAGGKSLSTLAAAYAKQHIKNHPKEAGGDNRGPWVRSYLDWGGKDARWCAGFVCFALEQAAHTLGEAAERARGYQSKDLSSGKHGGRLYSFAAEMSGASSFFMPTTW
jgi:hypothetical protein